MSVQLIIKSAAQCVEDFALKCELTWTIAEVKKQISALYPTKPKMEQQKLIFGGKLLPNDLVLQSIFNQVQDVYVMHLVCPLPPAPEPEKKCTNKGNLPPVYTAAPPLNPNNVFSQMNQPLLTSSDMTGGMASFSNALTTYPVTDSTQQYMAMQQMYMQLMTQYFAQYNNSMPHGPAPNVSQPVQQPQTTAPQQNIAAANRAPRHHEEEEDYIDYLYGFARVFILSTLLLYYSSLARVTIVTLMVLLVTMFVKMNRRRQREQILRANARQSPEVAAPADQQVTDETQNAENEVSEDSPTNETPVPETQTQTPNTPSVPSTIVTLVTAFFSSLIPTDPLPVNVN